MDILQVIVKDVILVFLTSIRNDQSTFKVQIEFNFLLRDEKYLRY